LQSLQFNQIIITKTKIEKMKINKFLSLLLAVTFMGIAGVSAQTMDDVVNKFNAAAELVNSDAAAAATLLQESIELANKVGPEADELRMMAESQLPAVYFRVGSEQQRDGNTDVAIESFNKSLDLGLEYNDPNTVARAQNILGRLYLSQGNNAYRANENEQAIELLTKSVEFDPENPRAYLLMGLSQRRLENLDGMITSMDQAIASAIKADDAQTQATAEKSVRDYLSIRANQSIQGNRGSEALKYLNMAVNYGEEAQTYFLLTLAYNSLQQWDNAINAAEKALALEVDNAGEKAKIYFEMGNALREKGNDQAACSAFKNAAHGNYAEAANYQIQQVLKCD
jgi:tetratricopeptide (TPR) repeat protein